MTEEVFPGFRFSVFSFVVSLLRPEIIRDRDLPRQGLHILPLESTLTPQPNSDYLAQWGDHDQNRRELARHSSRDAEAYDEFGLMHQMAPVSRAVKPTLGIVPPDPASLSLRDLAGVLKLDLHLRSLGATQFHALSKLLDDELGQFDGPRLSTPALRRLRP